MAVAAARSDEDGDVTFGDELRPGTRLLRGQFTIESFLNAGGYGITYLARDSLNRRVVIKECFPAAFCRRTDTRVSPRSRQREEEFRSVVKLFLQEAVTVSRLEHPNIVKVHQVFEDNDTAYIAMEHVEGPDLLEPLEGKVPRLTPAEIRPILTQVLDALAYVHGQGVLHRDISPDNILLDRATGRPVLIDFGAARKDVTRKSRALSGLRVVKDGYSPQEFYISGSTQTPSSDLYALAASFSHLITHEAPRPSQERLAAIANRQGDPQVPLRGRVKGYPASFLAAIDKAMSIFPRDRLQSVADWQAMLGDPDEPVPEIDELPQIAPAAPPPPRPGSARGREWKAAALRMVASVQPVLQRVGRRVGLRETLVPLVAAAVLVVGLIALVGAMWPRPQAAGPATLATAAPGMTKALRLPYVPDPGDSGRVSARLPWSPDWVTPGLQIVEINGRPVQPDSDLQALVAEGAGLDGTEAMQVIFGHVAATGNEVLRKVETLPVVDRLVLAPGLVFDVLTTPTGAQTVLVSQPLADQGDLRPGDMLVVYLPTGETLGTVSALQHILDRETAQDVATFGFALQRDGQMAAGSIRLQGES